MSKKYNIRQPTLCMIVGVPGSGKTVLAEYLTKRIIDGAYISKDLIQSSFTNERITGQKYSEIQGPTIKLLVDYADEHLNLGKIPIIDAPFSISNWRNDQYSDWTSFFKKVATKHKARLGIIRCVPPDLDELKRRIVKRNCEWDRWKLDNWDEFLKREPIDFPINHDDKFEVITNRPVEDIANAVLKYLNAHPCKIN